MRFRKTFNRLKRLFPIIFAILIGDYFGFFLILREKNFSESFKYPLEGDLLLWTNQLRNGHVPDVSPIHNFTKSLSYISFPALEKCRSRKRVIILVKSAVSHFQRRQAIRETWGKEAMNKLIRIFFLLGNEERQGDHVQELVASEHHLGHDDLIQGDFIDSYQNNTLKTLMGLHWSSQICSNSDYYFFVDDDFYISVKNLLLFLANPLEYPFSLLSDKRNIPKPKSYPDDLTMYAGFVHFDTKPMRARNSKWFISLEDYPYDRYPAFVTAGSCLLSRRTVSDFYWASHFVQPFQFDDIYLAIIAHKLHITPLKILHFYMDRWTYGEDDLRFLIASHEFGDPEELRVFWRKCKELGYV